MTNKVNPDQTAPDLGLFYLLSSIHPSIWCEKSMKSFKLCCEQLLSTLTFWDKAGQKHHHLVFFSFW